MINMAYQFHQWYREQPIINLYCSLHFQRINSDIQPDHIFSQRAEVTGLADLSWLIFWGDGTAEWAFDNGLGSVVFQGLKGRSVKISVNTWALELNIKILVEIELYRICTFLGECSVVLFVLSDLLRLGVKETSWLKIKNLTSEMSSSNKVLDFIIVLKCIFECKELMGIVHTTKCHIATKLCYSNSIIGLGSHQSLPLQFYSHSSNILYKPLGEMLDIL